jgi:hypothetical protein
VKLGSRGAGSYTLRIVKAEPSAARSTQRGY